MPSPAFFHFSGNPSQPGFMVSLGAFSFPHSPPHSRSRLSATPDWAGPGQGKTRSNTENFRYPPRTVRLRQPDSSDHFIYREIVSSPIKTEFSSKRCVHVSSSWDRGAVVCACVGTRTEREEWRSEGSAHSCALDRDWLSSEGTNSPSPKARGCRWPCRRLKPPGEAELEDHQLALESWPVT